MFSCNRVKVFLGNNMAGFVDSAAVFFRKIGKKQAALPTHCSRKNGFIFALPALPVLPLSLFRLQCDPSCKYLTPFSHG